MHPEYLRLRIRSSGTLGDHFRFSPALHEHGFAATNKGWLCSRAGSGTGPTRCYCHRGSVLNLLLPARHLNLCLLSSVYIARPIPHAATRLATPLRIPTPSREWPSGISYYSKLAQGLLCSLTMPDKSTHDLDILLDNLSVTEVKIECHARMSQHLVWRIITMILRSRALCGNCSRLLPKLLSPAHTYREWFHAQRFCFQPLTL